MPPRTTQITALELCHFYCRAIPSLRGAQAAVDILRTQGATFTGYGQPVAEVKAFLKPDGGILQEPGAVLSEDGSVIVGLDMRHRLLVPDRLATAATGREKGTVPEGVGSFGFFTDTPGVRISQGADFRHSPPADLLSTGLLALGCHLYPHLRPGHGWVDESGWNMPDGDKLAALTPRFLFWANFFGPERVDAIGRAFLKAAPGWYSVDLDDGGILHVATESYRDWWGNDQPDLLAYFRRKFPKVRLYRAEPIP